MSCPMSVLQMLGIGGRAERGPCVAFLLGLLLASSASAETRPTASRASVPLPPWPSFTAVPWPWPSSMLYGEPGRWYLPSAVLERHGRPAEVATLPSLRLRPTADLPPLAALAGPPLAGPYLVPSGPLAYTPSPEVARLTAPWRPVEADPERATAAGDPALEAVRRRLLSAIPEQRQKPAPFLRLTVPNPLELPQEVRLSQPRADTDGPARDFDLPPKPVLPLQIPVQK